MYITGFAVLIIVFAGSKDLLLASSLMLAFMVLSGHLKN